MSKIELPPLRDVDTASLAYGGRSVDYIDGYEAGYEAAADQLRARDRQIVEVCAQIAENCSRCHPDDAEMIATALRSLIAGANNG